MIVQDMIKIINEVDEDCRMTYISEIPGLTNYLQVKDGSGINPVDERLDKLNSELLRAQENVRKISNVVDLHVRQIRETITSRRHSFLFDPWEGGVGGM